VSEVAQIGLIKLLNLGLHHVVILPHYGNGTNDGMPSGCSKNREEMARLEAKIDVMNAKLDAHQGEMTAQVSSLTSWIDANQEEMKAMLDAYLDRMVANPGEQKQQTAVISEEREGNHQQYQRMEQKTAATTGKHGKW
jgi:peptidoglycan hydrolase CwlO-like protein